MSMFRSSLNFGFRIMRKHPLQSIIQLAGLSIGILSLIFAFIFLLDQGSFDQHWSKKEQIHKAYQHSTINGIDQVMPLTTLGMANQLTEVFPEIEAYTRVHPQKVTLQGSQKEMIQVDGFLIDTSFASIFDLKLLSGSLKETHGDFKPLAISKSFAERCFKGIDPIGKIIQDFPQWSKKPNEYVISAVFDDLPSHTHLHAEVYFIHKPNTAFRELGGQAEIFYYLFKKGVDTRLLQQKINQWYQNLEETTSIRYEFQPIEEVYLNHLTDRMLVKKGNKHLFNLIGIGAITLMLLSSINFINLFTAQTVSRLKETGVRKVMGASIFKLTMQHLVETCFYFFMSTCIAMIGWIALSPSIGSLFALPTLPTPLSNPLLFAGLLLGMMGIGLLIGLYPALTLARLDPVLSLNKKFNKRTSISETLVRKTFVTIQFVLAVILLFAVFVIRGQVKLFEQKKLGYTQEQLLHIDPIYWGNNLKAFKDRLSQTSGVESVGIGMWNPWSMSMSKSGLKVSPDAEKSLFYDLIIADPAFVNTLDLTLVQSAIHPDRQGQAAPSTLSKTALNEPSDPESNPNSQRIDVLITEHTAQQLGIQHVPTQIEGSHPGEILDVKGIIADMHTKSLHQPYDATVIWLIPEWNDGDLYIKTAKGSENQVAHTIAELWPTYFPHQPLHLHHVKDKMDAMYEQEQNQLLMIQIISGLTLLIALLGVIGLLSHAISAKRKEIGIRKVLGSTVWQVMSLLSKEFLLLALVSICIASPIAWYCMQQWLANYAFQYELQVWILLASGGIMIGMALLSTAYFTIKAAVANPVDSLRDE
jgi:putative ABC transport system permease protein